MKIILVSKCSLDIEQYVEFKMSVLISPSKSLISSRWVTYMYVHCTIEIDLLLMKIKQLPFLNELSI